MTIFIADEDVRATSHPDVPLLRVHANGIILDVVTRTPNPAMELVHNLWIHTYQHSCPFYSLKDWPFLEDWNNLPHPRLLTEDLDTSFPGFYVRSYIIVHNFNACNEANHDSN